MRSAINFMILRKKIEAALVAYLQDQDDLAELNFYHGHDTAEKELPCVVVHCSSLQDAMPDFMPKTADVQIVLAQSIDDGTENDFDAAASVIETAMQDLESLKDFVNKQNTNDRPVSDFFLYDVQENGQETMFEDRRRGLGFSYVVVCEAQDN